MTSRLKIERQDVEANRIVGGASARVISSRCRLRNRKNCARSITFGNINDFFRLLLGLFMTYAGFSHLTFNRQEFVAQVPTWLQFSEGFTDFVVLASGVVEIALGLGMLLLWKKKAVVGALLALFYVAIFPGNISQYVNHIDAFGLTTDTLRLIRLFIQPVLIFLALWSTGGWQPLKEWWQCLTKSKKA